MPEETVKFLQPIIQNTAAIKAKLDDAQDEMQDAPMLITYEHGGGQSGSRENPIFRIYESMWKSYMSGMKTIMSYMPDKGAETKKKERNQTKRPHLIVIINLIKMTRNLMTLVIRMK